MYVKSEAYTYMSNSNRRLQDDFIFVCIFSHTAKFRSNDINRVEAYFGDIASSLLDQYNKGNISIKYESNEFFGFSVCIKVMFTLYCNLLSMNGIMSKNCIP